jgi:hypothetical protein
VITRAEAEKLVDEDIGVMASEQIRQGLIKAKEAGLSDATAEACSRALPAIERKIESLCPAIIGGTKHGFAAAYGPMLENPQAMIPLCVLANSRGNCLAVSVLKMEPFEYSEDKWAQNMAKRDTRAAAWYEVDEVSALDSEGMNAALSEVWRRCKPRCGRRASFSHGKSGGYLGCVPHDAGTAAVAIIREYYSKALQAMAREPGKEKVR